MKIPLLIIACLLLWYCLFALYLRARMRNGFYRSIHVREFQISIARAKQEAAIECHRALAKAMNSEDPEEIMG